MEVERKFPEVPIDKFPLESTVASEKEQFSKVQTVREEGTRRTLASAPP